jgi:hypothetical protein
MATIPALRVGETYYALYFHDPQRRFPQIETRVYLGHDLEQSHTSSLGDHYFQTAESYFHDGSWCEMTENQRKSLHQDSVVVVNADSLGLTCDLPELIARLSLLLSRNNGKSAA